MGLMPLGFVFLCWGLHSPFFLFQLLISHIPAQNYNTPFLFHLTSFESSPSNYHLLPQYFELKFFKNGSDMTHYPNSFVQFPNDDNINLETMSPTAQQDQHLLWPRTQLSTAYTNPAPFPFATQNDKICFKNVLRMVNYFDQLQGWPWALFCEAQRLQSPSTIHVGQSYTQEV